ncbi:extracellular serine-rich protein [Stemphylium lycopersici]|uniref:Extracellular serine-rich protein n=1 Tax=Stemphylium lycopersici TaxID=183478 RepID=A0A364MSN6_STELY|nr:extracellular serine-rich protein [Stemphylium lycopersici]RAQ98812.1 extracellular serine-rich protein [Stemphylium lycopersici]RAR02103.1 extracellular serine-rich protein [Stemphylium lycopersici]
MPTLLTRAVTSILMLVNVLAQSPSQTMTDDRMSVTSLSTSAVPTASIASLTSSAATEASSGGARVHLVKAGAGGFQFEPAELTNVSAGDVITFEFYPPDHSVVRAEYGSACVPYEYTGRDRTGFWSETQWVKTPNDITHWNLTINTTEPIFYYCAAPDSCKGKQMVGVINPNDTQTLHGQILAAARADYQLAPGDPVPKEASSTLTSSPTASSEGDLQSADRSPPALSPSAIAGITVGGVLFLSLCAGLLFFFKRKSRSGRRADTALSAQTRKQVDAAPAELYGGEPYVGEPYGREKMPQ